MSRGEAEIKTEVVRRLAETGRPESPNQILLDELRTWAVEYLDEYDEELTRFPHLAGQTHWNLWMRDARLDDALFVVILLQRRADRQGKIAYCRLNVASDLDWISTVRRFPRIRFYDYTKVRSRIRRAIDGSWPENYSLTLSHSERVTWPAIERTLQAGLNVSVVFDTEYVPQAGRIDQLPADYRGYPVIDGDTHDLRHSDFDGRGNLIGLRFKGSRKLLGQAIERGFVVSAN